MSADLTPKPEPLTAERLYRKVIAQVVAEMHKRGKFREMLDDQAKTAAVIQALALASIAENLARHPEEPHG